MPGADNQRRLEHLEEHELQPLLRRFEPGYPETLIDFAQVMFVELMNQGHAPDRAAVLAHALTEALRREIGGQRLYMTRGVHFEARSRARLIQTQFNGRNVTTLARLHDLSEERVRQILRDQVLARRRADAQQLAELQPQLPLEPTGGEAS